MSFEVKRDNWCRHRTAFDRDKFPVCKVGVDYHQFDGPFNTKPCLGESAEAKARCSQYSGWTAEEIAEREREVEASMNRIRAAITAIREAVGGKRGLGGSIPCPTCSKPLHYSIARLNGHIHARCETPQCVSFMERRRVSVSPET